MEQEISAKLAELEQRVKGDGRRIETLERGQDALNRLVTAVEVLAAKQNDMGQSVERLSLKLDALESRPARRWEALIDKVLLLLSGAFVTFLLSGGSGT
jgi:hypothetical protein